MFTSHKSDAPPRSRQSSVDSPVTGPSSPTSPPEPWPSQCFDDYPYGAMQSPEQRPRAYCSKRSSVFNLRSRSNTATSTVSSLSPLGMGHDESRPGSPFFLRQYGHQETEPSASRKSLFRGKKGKRLSESVSSSIILTEYQDMDMGDKRTSVLRKGKRRNNQPDAPRKCSTSTRHTVFLIDLHSLWSQTPHLESFWIPTPYAY